MKERITLFKDLLDFCKTVWAFMNKVSLNPSDVKQISAQCSSKSDYSFVRLSGNLSVDILVS